MSSEHLFQKLLEFLAGVKAQPDGRQCVKLELTYAPGNFREEPLFSYLRKDEPELFESQALTEQLVGKVIETATNHADSFAAGNHRYILRSYQHLGGVSQYPFKIATSMAASGGVDMGMDMTVPGHGHGGGGSDASAMAAQTLTQNNAALMKINQMMFDSSFRTLSQMTIGVTDENAALKAENATLRRENEELRSNRMRDEWDIHMQREEMARKNRTGDMLNQLIPVVAAKIMSGDGKGGGGDGSAMSPLGMLVRQLKESIRPEQLPQLMNALDQGQVAIFVNIMQMVSDQDSASGQAA